MASVVRQHRRQVRRIVEDRRRWTDAAAKCAGPGLDGRSPKSDGKHKGESGEHRWISGYGGRSSRPPKHRSAADEVLSAVLIDLSAIIAALHLEHRLVGVEIVVAGQGQARAEAEQDHSRKQRPHGLSPRSVHRNDFNQPYSRKLLCERVHKQNAGQVRHAAQACRDARRETRARARSRSSEDKPQNFAAFPKGASRDIAAKHAGFSNHATYEQAQVVVDAGDPQLTEMTDSSGVGRRPQRFRTECETSFSYLHSCAGTHPPAALNMPFSQTMGRLGAPRVAPPQGRQTLSPFRSMPATVEHLRAPPEAVMDAGDEVDAAVRAVGGAGWIDEQAEAAVTAAKTRPGA